MIVIAGDWIESEYITIDENGWHCADDAPEEIRREYEKYMKTVGNSGAEIYLEE